MALIYKNSVFKSDRRMLIRTRLWRCADHYNVKDRNLFYVSNFHKKENVQSTKLLSFLNEA